MKTQKKFLQLMVPTALATGAALVFVLESGGAHAAAGSNPPARLNVQDGPLSHDVKVATSFAPIVKKVAPAVVNISSSMTVRDRSMLNPFGDDPFLRRFFGGDGSGRQTPRSRHEYGLGSGVVVTSDGYILTANHVVEGADKVKVSFASGDKDYDAKIVGTDPPTDVAVLRIETKSSLPAIVIADSDKLEVGDTVLALGNPFAVGQTVTMGIVSAVGRGGFGINGLENFIQTDAAINPGNSGGPLVDAEGRLVGINTAILSRTGGFQGVGFAVPINMARFVMDRLINEGKVTRGYLGINIQPLTPDLAKEFHLPDESSGVLVGGVSAGSAAEKAGVRDGDVILDYNGKKMTDPRSLQLAVTQARPGSEATLRILRSSELGKPTEKTVKATLGELPQDAFASNGRSGQGERGQSGMDALDGVEVTDLDSGSRRQLDIPGNVRGALVTTVEQDSNAADAGLRQGDVIMEINHQAIRNADDAVKESERAKSDRLLLRVWSRSETGASGTRYLAVDNTKRQ
jgi:serine protease Do